MSCDHISMYRRENGTDSYEILHAFYVSCTAKNSLKVKAKNCICMADRCRSYQRIHACLFCVYFGCFNNRHIHEHARAKDHLLAIDTNSGHVYCFMCSDYKYDPEFEKIAQEQQLIAALNRVEPLKSQPNMGEIPVLKERIFNVDKMALRGIINMGNTCYISVILLALVHAPLFRDYFLNLQHKCDFQRSILVSQDISSDSTKPEPVCFACEISNIVQEFFAGKVEPFVPDRLLYLLWKSNIEDRLKNTDQQSAHDIFLVLLEILHESCQRSNPDSNHIDKIFTGIFKHVKTCQKCCRKDPQDTQLNKSKDVPFKTIDILIHETSTTNGVPGSSCLTDYLSKSYINVVPGACVCKENTSFNGHTTIKKLPFIIIFQINHPLPLKKGKFISFPEFLDMSPYILSRESQNKEDKLNSVGGSSNNNMFYLFAVVEHQGKDEVGGHYICYVRRNKSDWFICDDDAVDKVNIKEVLSKDTNILLFYHKEILEYEKESIKAAT